MKKILPGLLTLAFLVSFLSACNAYTPGPVTSRSQAAPIPVPTTEAAPTTTAAPETTVPPTTADANIWVETTAPETTEAHIYLYAVSPVNVREGANKNSDVIATLSEGQKVEKLGEEGSWIMIDYKGQTAYVYGQYLSEEEP